MLKNITQFKIVIQDIESVFLFDQSCPIAIAKEALFECLKWIGQVEDQVKAQQAEAEAKKAAEEPKTDEAKVE